MAGDGRPYRLRGYGQRRGNHLVSRLISSRSRGKVKTFDSLSLLVKCSLRDACYMLGWSVSRRDGPRADCGMQ
jgi:hypothetical protein